MHTCLAAIVANTSLPQNSETDFMHDFFEISTLDVHSNTHINSHSGTHTCSHMYMHIMHILILLSEVESILKV